MIRYEQQHRQGYVICNTCNKKGEYEAADFSAFKVMTTRDGWKHEKRGDDWIHVCAACGSVNSQTKHKMRKATLDVVLDHCRKRMEAVKSDLKDMMIVPESLQREANARTEELDRIVRIIENEMKSNQWLAQKAKRTKLRRSISEVGDV